MQDALLAAHRHLKEFRGDAQLSTWLTAIVINCARMHLRKRSRYIHVSLDSRIGEDEEVSAVRHFGGSPAQSRGRVPHLVGECTVVESPRHDFRRPCGGRFTFGLWIIFPSAKQLAFWEFPSER